MGERRRGRLERRRSLDALLSSDTDQWLTPLDFLAVLLRLGPVVFDPCGNPLSVVPAARQVLLPEDGLTASWPARGLVFCNPPYGRDLPAWAARLAAHAAAGGEVVSLVPARTDTGWWSTLDPVVWCAWSGRLRFLQTVADWRASAAGARWAAREKKRAAKHEAGERRRLDAAQAAGENYIIKPYLEAAPVEVSPGLLVGDAAPFPVAVCYHGPRVERFCTAFGASGPIYKRVAVSC